MLTLIRSFRLLLAMSAPLFFMANTFADDLAARVTSQIEASPDLKGASISVKALGPTVWLSGAATIEEQQAARRQELLRRKTLSPADDRELQGLLYKYREELKRRHSLEPHEAVDLQWIYDHPPEVRLGEL